jgi:hypothetical protein
LRLDRPRVCLRAGLGGLGSCAGKLMMRLTLRNWKALTKRGRKQIRANEKPRVHRQQAGLFGSPGAREHDPVGARCLDMVNGSLALRGSE